VRSSSEPCTACGFCCTYLEFRSAVAARGSDRAWLEAHPGVRVVAMPYGPTVRIASVCAHLSGDLKCRIYPERPELCKSFLCVGRENEPSIKGEADAEA
jgi:Fe-S-cluster containining protein